MLSPAADAGRSDWPYRNFNRAIDPSGSRFAGRSHRGRWQLLARLARSDVFRRRSSFSSHSSRSASTAGTGLHAPKATLGAGIVRIDLERTEEPAEIQLLLARASGCQALRRDRPGSANGDGLALLQQAKDLLWRAESGEREFAERREFSAAMPREFARSKYHPPQPTGQLLMRAARLTAWPMQVKSRRLLLPILP